MLQKENYLKAYLADRERSLHTVLIRTNEDVRYQRNRIRHRIIYPELESINPNVVDAIARLGRFCT